MRIVIDASWYFNQQHYQKTTRKKNRQNSAWLIFIEEGRRIP